MFPKRHQYPSVWFLLTGPQCVSAAESLLHGAADGVRGVARTWFREEETTRTATHCAPGDRRLFILKHLNPLYSSWQGLQSAKLHFVVSSSVRLGGD